ncbi:MAG: sulfatase family protein [Promethearchaeota archaeon]
MIEDKPNILIFFPDQHRGDWMPYTRDVFKRLGMQELPLRMPNIKKMMKNGVSFTNAITSSPLCAPARACLAAGLRYKNCKVKGNHENFPIDQKVYYSILKEHEYSVGSVGKLDLHKPSLYWGLNGWIPDLEMLGFTHVIDCEGKWDAILSVIMENDDKEKKKRVKPKDFKPKGPYLKYLQENDLLITHVKDFLKRFGKRNFNTEPTPLPEDAYCDNWIGRKAIEMLRRFPEDKPWHLVVNFTGPHDPWDVTKRMKKAWEHVSFPAPHAGNEETVDDEIKVRQNYAAMLENIDRNIGLILEEVKKAGQLSNTIVIYTSDHGEMLGDFKRYGKTRPERGSVKIPLVITGPNIEKGKYSDALVELQDLTKTILDYAGAEMREARDSLSFRKILEGTEKDHRECQISALDLSDIGSIKWKMISNGKYKLIIENSENIRLHDMEVDPWEDHNIAEKRPSVVAELLKKLNC